MSRPSRSLRRLQVISVSTACALGALGSSAAFAAPISATATGHATYGAIPTGGRIVSAVTSVDPATGVWTTTVTFDAAQSATVGSALSVALEPEGGNRSYGWAADTDPDRIDLPQTTLDHVATSYNGSPGAQTSIAFDAARTAVTLTATDPALIGVEPDTVRASTSARDGGTQYSTASLFLGATAPRTTIPAAAKQLTAAPGGTIHVPLAALKTKADRRVVVKLHGTPLALKFLPAKYSARREAVMRLSKSAIKRLGRGNRSVVLQVETRLDNGSHAYVRRTVRLRRR